MDLDLTHFLFFVFATAVFMLGQWLFSRWYSGRRDKRR